MHEASRETILADDMIRPPTPGLRPFSVGILRLCQKLGLRIVMPVEERGPVDPDRDRLEETAICFLLDETNDLLPFIGRQDVPLAHIEQELRRYEFRITPALLRAVKAEVENTFLALGAGAYHVASKPKDPKERGEKPVSPPGKY